MSNQIFSKSTDQRINTNLPEGQGLTIIAENLSKRFNREWIFKNFNYQFASGNTYAITGPNGSGKSTLLQILWAQVPQTSGNLLFKDAVSEIPAEEFYKHIAIAAPYMDLIDEFTLTEQVDFHFKLKKIRDGLSLQPFLKAVYLEEARDKYIGNFSSGMKQRLKLGLAMYTDAAVIFLDEPGTNLDSGAFAWYEQQLKTLPAQSIVFIASNNPREYPSNAKIIDLLDYKN